MHALRPPTRSRRIDSGDRDRPAFLASPIRWLGLGVLLFGAVCSGCASTSVPPITVSDFVPDSDEQELWSRADEADARIAEAGVLFRNEDVERYLDGIARRLLPHIDAADAPFRIRLIVDPLLNAFASPNGSVYLHTGIVARTENEAQLAFVVAHELLHYTRRHSLKEYRVARNRHSAAVAGSVLAAIFAGVVLDPGSLAGHLSNVQTSGYSRDLEREADADALEALRLAGYDIREAPKIFEQLIAETRQIEQSYYYGSHPKLTDRLADAQQTVSRWHPASTPAAGESDTPSADPGPERSTRHDGLIADVLLENAKRAWAMGFRGKAHQNIRRHVAARSMSTDGLMLLGRIHQSRASDDEHRGLAIDAYRRAARSDDTHALAHRELGLLLRGSSPDEHSTAALRRYLELSPEALDRAVIEGLLGRPDGDKSRPIGVAP